jgi:hypothetical protein
VIGIDFVPQNHEHSISGPCLTLPLRKEIGAEIRKLTSFKLHQACFVYRQPATVGDWSSSCLKTFGLSAIYIVKIGVSLDQETSGTTEGERLNEI